MFTEGLDTKIFKAQLWNAAGWITVYAFKVNRKNSQNRASTFHTLPFVFKNNILRNYEYIS
jgi:hypothetical protein